MDRAARPHWPFVVTTALAWLVFAMWWIVLAFLHALGTCGEDSDLDEDEYPRLCGPTGEASSWDELGSVFQTLYVMAGAATLAALFVGILAARLRAWWPVQALVVGLLVCGVVGFNLG
jgi:hypothetical protein